MRTTISIPDEFYKRIKEEMGKRGFVTINDFVLDLIRHQIDIEQDIKKIEKET